jgi:hypothetical protein
VLERLTSKDFDPYLNQSFTVQVDPSTVVEMDLIEVTPHGPEPEAEVQTERRRPFSLVFRAWGEAHLPQRMYRVEHDRFGSVEIFLVPIGPDRQGMRYEAVFN